MWTLKNFGDHMTNKMRERINLYGTLRPDVIHLAVAHNDYRVLDITLEKGSDFGSITTYFTSFWTKTNY